jgi:hypothetical protein
VSKKGKNKEKYVNGATFLTAMIINDLIGTVESQKKALDVMMAKYIFLEDRMIDMEMRINLCKEEVNILFQKVVKCSC